MKGNVLNRLKGVEEKLRFQQNEVGRVIIYPKGDEKELECLYQQKVAEIREADPNADVSYPPIICIADKSKESFYSMGQRLLKHVEIQVAIQKAMDNRSKKI